VDCPEATSFTILVRESIALSSKNFEVGFRLAFKNSKSRILRIVSRFLA